MDNLRDREALDNFSLRIKGKTYTLISEACVHFDMLSYSDVFPFPGV